jgi:hypothetical protein
VRTNLLNKKNINESSNNPGTREMNTKTPTEVTTGTPNHFNLMLDDKVVIVEERNPKGEVVEKYTKGRFLGKVF